LSRARILIIEDDLLIVMDLQTTLEDLGHQVVGTISRGEEACQTIQETFAEVVLMDIRLGGPLDGIATAKLIRSQFDIPVVFLTAAADLNEGSALTDRWQVVNKPFREKELQSAIEMALEKHEATNC
jgi:CheY-like chemotaxis protein